MADLDLFTLPDPAVLPGLPERCVMHWTAGGYQANVVDVQHYHALIEWPVRIVAGVPIRNNMRFLDTHSLTYSRSTSGYAAHTRGFNSWSVGYALCGMLGAVDRDNRGTHPIVPEQVDALIGLCANTALVFGMPVNEHTFFTHYEAQALHGVPQAGKIDITWCPNEPQLGPDEVGPWLREQISERLP